MLILSLISCRRKKGKAACDSPSVEVTSDSKNLAIEYYIYGLSLDSNHPHLYTNFGSLLREQGKISDAIVMYERAVECDPKFNIALANLGSTLKDKGDAPRAAYYYQKALDVDPNFVDVALFGIIITDDAFYSEAQENSTVEIRINERRVIVNGLSFPFKIDAVEVKLQVNGGIINLWNNNGREMFRQMQSDGQFSSSAAPAAATPTGGCTEGQTTCQNGKYAVCNYNAWVLFDCAAGTVCQAATFGIEVFVGCLFPPTSSTASMETSQPAQKRDYYRHAHRF